MKTQGDGCAPIQQKSQSSYIKASLGDRLSTILIDTGASHPFISKYVFDNKFQFFFHLFTFEKVVNTIPVAFYSVCSFLLTDNRYI